MFDNLMEDMSAYFTGLSPVEGNGITQDLLVPVLRAQVEQAGVDLRYNIELIEFETDEDGISAVICDRIRGKTRRVRSKYLVGTDGSKSGTRTQLGIGQHREGTLCHLISMVFDADIHELFNSQNQDVDPAKHIAARPGGHPGRSGITKMRTAMTSETRFKRSPFRTFSFYFHTQTV